MRVVGAAETYGSVVLSRCAVSELACYSVWTLLIAVPSFIASPCLVAFEVPRESTTRHARCVS
jgi:hypothetical protein